MALTEKLELLLTADPTQGISALKQFSSEAEKTAKASKSSLEKIGTGALKLGVGGLAVGGFLTNLASASVEAANQLDAAIKQAGQTQSDYTQRIDDTIDSMTQFGITDKEVTSALTKLVFAYNDTGKALDQIQLSADLAARKQISLADAAGLVAKAHGGSTKLFKEYGIQVQENADGTKDLDGALTDLAQKLSGQAAAAADSWNGQLRELRAQVENLAVDFAEKWGPTIEVVSAAMTVFGGAVTGVSAMMGKLRTAQAANAAASEAQAVATAEAAAAEAALATNSAAAVASLYAQSTAATTLSLSANGLAAKLALLPAALRMIPAAGAGAGGMREIDQDIKESVDAITNQSLPELQTAFKDLRGNLDDSGVIDWFKKLAEASPEAATKTRDALAAQGEDVSALDAIIQDAKTHTEGMATAQDTLAAATKKAADELQAMSNRYKDIRKAADDAYTAALKLAPADIRVKQGALQISDAKARLTEAEQDLADAQAGTKVSSQDLAQAHLNQEKAVADLADAQAELAKKPGDPALQRAVRQAFLDVQKANAATSDLKSSGGIDPKKVDEAQRAVDDASLAYISAVQNEAVAASDLKATQDEAAGATSNAETKTYDYLAALGFLNARLTGPTHDALATYIWDTTVAANKTKELADMRAREATGIVPFHTLERTAANRAAGGTGFPGSTYFIEPGTKGEYFTPTQSGWFTPVDKMGKGGYTVNIGQIVTADPADAGEAVARRLRIEAVLASP